MRIVFTMMFVGVLVAGLAWYIITERQSATLAPVEVATTTATSTATTPVEVGTTTAEEVFDDIEPLLMALDMKTWQWQETRLVDGRVVTPVKPGVFTLSFGGSGAVEIGTDCNSMSSTYEAYNGNLTFGPIMSTKMFCEGSQETEFVAFLETFATYQFTGKGELLVKTKDDSKVIFK